MTVSIVRTSLPIIPKRIILALGAFLPLQALTAVAVYAQCSLVCNNNLQVSLAQNGTALITTAMIAPSAATTCPGVLTLELADFQGNPLPNPLTCAEVGQAVYATVRHSSGNYCTGTLEVQDALPPQLSCPDKFVWCNQEPDPETAGLPAANDNCTAYGDLELNWTDQETTLGCGVLQNGIPVLKRIDRHWTVTDASGNNASCTQRIWLKHITLQQVTFPPNHDGFAAPALDCSQNPDDLSLTGEPAVEGIPIGINGACELNVTYSDQRVNYCPPAGYSVLRTWTAVDFCAGAVLNRVQVIKIQDVTAPEIVAPADITVGTNGIQCAASVLLPHTTATDNCSSVSITPQWEFGSGYGPFANIPFGEYTVQYLATDACGNVAVTTMKVTVEDQTPPQAICKAALQISLSAAGAAYLTPLSLDAGSFDNCGPVFLSLSKDGTYFYDNLVFSCEDQGNTITVQLKVKDESGLENLCETDVTIRDFLKPVLQCPASLTITCLQDYAAPAVSGQASASDNCELLDLTMVETPNLGGCGVGSVLRSWTATDAAGNTKSCSQLITIIPTSTVTVSFPANVALTNCIDAQSLLPANTGQPQTNGQHCSPLSITYSDQSTAAPLPYCRRILRSWKVIDWCVYTGNAGSPGIWEKVQIIDFVDHVAPDLVVPADVTLSAQQADCQVWAALTPASSSDCSATPVVVHNSSYASAPGADASGFYPVGTYDLVFTATDGCGNSVQKTAHLLVKDGVAPTAICKNNVPVSLGAGGTVTLDPAWFDAGSVDACSNGGLLTLNVVPDVLDCQHKGNQQLILTVTDAAGNHSSCVASALAGDPGQFCNPVGDYFSIGGGVRTETGDTVRNIPVTLLAEQTQWQTDCDTNGVYRFDDVAAGHNYRLVPYNNANWYNGVSTFDLLLISKHILGIEPLGSPYKMIAADANKSGSITTFDIVQLRKLILGVYDTVPGVTSWRFVPADFVFSMPNNPFSTAFPEEISVDSLHGDLGDRNFIGIKVGDTNNSVSGAQAREQQDTLYVTAPNQVLLPGERRRIPLHFSEDQLLSGFQFEVQIDTQLFVLEAITCSDSTLLRPENTALNRTRNLVSVSWNSPSDVLPIGVQQPLLDLQLRAKIPALLSDGLQLAHMRLRAEAYTRNTPAALSFLWVEKTENVEKNTGFYPNPFVSQTFLPFKTTQNESCLLRIYDACGHLAYSEQMNAGPGEQRWSISAADLPHGGVYTYKLSLSSGGFMSGKMVFARF